jgi:hypothetical protein
MTIETDGRGIGCNNVKALMSRALGGQACGQYVGCQIEMRYGCFLG